MAALPEEIVFKGICDYSACWNPLWICRSCYRGQVYCSGRCSELGRKEKCRVYKQRYQQGNGRKKHNKCQNEYRLRQRKAEEAGAGKKVTDHTSPAPSSDGNLATGVAVESVQAPDEYRETQKPQKGLPPCQVCGRKSVLVEPLSETKRVAELFRRGRVLRRAWNSAMRQRNRQTEADYTKAILDIFVSLPDTPRRPRRDDRYLAQQFHRQDIPLWQVETAMLLATARRVFRDEPYPLEPIRSLRYFVGSIDEVRRSGADEGYLHYLRDKLSHVVRPKPPGSPTPPIRGPTRRSRQLKFPW
jgi:hypothetical protein